MTKSPINRALALIASALALSGLVQCQGQGTMQVRFEGQMNHDARYYESGMAFWNTHAGPEVLSIIPCSARAVILREPTSGCC